MKFSLIVHVIHIIHLLQHSNYQNGNEDTDVTLKQLTEHIRIVTNCVIAHLLKPYGELRVLNSPT